MDFIYTCNFYFFIFTKYFVSLSTLGTLYDAHNKVKRQTSIIGRYARSFSPLMRQNKIYRRVQYHFLYGASWMVDWRYAMPFSASFNQQLQSNKRGLRERCNSTFGFNDMKHERFINFSQQPSTSPDRGPDYPAYPPQPRPAQKATPVANASSSQRCAWWRAAAVGPRAAPRSGSSKLERRHDLCALHFYANREEKLRAMSKCSCLKINK